LEQFPSDYIFWILYIEISKLYKTMYVKEFLFFICVRKCNCDYFSIKTMYVICIFTLEWHSILYLCKILADRKKNHQTQILCGTSHDPSEGLWSLNLPKFVSNSFFFLLNFENAQKIIFNLQTFLLLFSIVQLEKILTDKATIKNWNRRWARSALKALYVQY